MRRIAIQIGLILFLIAFSRPARAQMELIEFAHPFHARNLAGGVVDSTGAPVSGVLIEECDVPFTPVQARGSSGEPIPEVLHGDCDQYPKHVLASTKTDANGHFAFPQARMGTAHYLFVRVDGWDPMQITVKLRWFAKGNLRIRLHIAT